MPKRTLALIIALLLITAGLLYLALSPKGTTRLPGFTTPSPTPTPVAQTTLMLSPNPSIASSAATVSVDIDTMENKVTAVQLELTYDPKMINVTDITTPTVNGFFTTPFPLIKNIDRVNGKISYAFGIRPTDSGVKGKGTVATISFIPLTANGQTSINFSPETQVTAEGINGSVLKESLGTSVILTAEPSATTAPLQTQVTIQPTQ